ncbi:hypothetical protein ACTA71_008611 [Dictyostelium dimigraforme]
MGNRAFKSHHGHYLSAEGDAVKTHHNHHDHHTHFFVENHGDKVALRTHCGKYVSIGDHKQVYLSSHLHGDHSLFHLEHHGNKVSIKGHHHHYITADHHGHVSTKEHHDHDTTFEQIVI